MSTWNGIIYEVFDDILERNRGNIPLAIRDADDALKKNIYFAYIRSPYGRLEKYSDEKLPGSLAERFYHQSGGKSYNEREEVKSLMFFQRELTTGELFPTENLSEIYYEGEHSTAYIMGQWENAIREYEKTPGRRKNDALPHLVRNELYRIDLNTAQALHIYLNEKDNPHRDRTLTWEKHIPKLKKQFPDLPELPTTRKM